MAKGTIRAGVFSAVLGAIAIGSLSVAFVFTSADIAVAKGGKSGGKSDNRGSRPSSPDTGAGSGSSGLALLGLMGKKPATPTTAAVVANYAPEFPVLPAMRPGNGKFAAEIKNLNAANANLMAFLHADPDSQVGRIATYRETLIVYQGMLDDIAALQAEYDAYMKYGYVPDGWTLQEYEEYIYSIPGQIAAIEAELPGLEDELSAQLDDAADPNDAPEGDALEYFHSLLKLDEGSLFQE